MTQAKITTKGQVTIPKQVRDRLGLRTGDELEFIEEAEGGYRVRKRLAGSPFKKYRGYLKRLSGQDPDRVIEEMRGE